ncbi:lytic polysaccharide monooxygenase [Providencia stuartii]|uniref:lytic polysaccharide monooxygenase n=1 Tax=Providencia TaxID=586 RepID=UPI000CE66AC8|nr:MULTISPECIES: lytic polysaccharide monooxygenase [Providencia]AVE43491.1 aminopeptidase [Providencia stuartii]MBN5558376.1 lytic polysaccharide monooxygenase [Providencia stuartii]MBQ0457979.1 lytic polysaccharide monooxygenase [Providencia stuartii]MBQ0693412.1 lytic polysaccharide monooxygenase [Providencia stuartii]MDN0005183.1 lytic polysaccharide monooxygenase [Providencia stuartii]
MKKRLLLLPFLFCFSAITLGHGYVEEPKSRAFLCKKNLNSNCGAIQYEPQSLEGPKGFPLSGPQDGQIASAGIPRFAALDEQTSARWVKNIITEPQQTFKWYLTARHATANWQYFITKPDWNPNLPITREQLILIPFCQYATPSRPETIVEHQCVLPKENRGYQIVLAVWSIADTENAFYQVIDLDIK